MNRTTEHLDREIERVEEAIVRNVANLRRTLDRIDQNVEDGNRLNDLGEIRWDGPEIDRLIALRQSLYDTKVVVEDDEKRRKASETIEMLLNESEETV